MSRAPVTVEEKIALILQLFDYKKSTFSQSIEKKLGINAGVILADTKYTIFCGLKSDLETKNYTELTLNARIAEAATAAFAARKAYITEITKKSDGAQTELVTHYKKPGSFEKKLTHALNAAGLPVPFALSDYTSTNSADRHQILSLCAGGSANRYGLMGGAPHSRVIHKPEASHPLRFE